MNDSLEFRLGLYAHAFAIAKKMNANGYNLLSGVHVSADGCQFFIQSAHLHGLE
jgi:hypothetical protein